MSVVMFEPRWGRQDSRLLFGLCCAGRGLVNKDSVEWDEI